MAMSKDYKSANEAWHQELYNILENGQTVSPRGMESKEVLNNTFSFPMERPIVHNKQRKLSYKFMAAEAYWIISGDNTVAGIAPYNKHIAQFSDNDVIFNGAYGPPFREQVPYIARTLIKDNYTRQAVMTIWNRRPEDSKDVPCTVALTWNIRGGKLNCHVFMRSSDAWLGLPYDMFNFTMMTYYVGHQLHTESLGVGRMYMNLVSSHLYEKHYSSASKLLIHAPVRHDTPTMPLNYLMWPSLERSLIYCRDSVKPPEDPTIWQIRP